MIILGIETSCDETGAAVVQSDHRSLTPLSNVVASSLALHATTGGIIPEVAAREQIKYIQPVLTEALLPLGKDLYQALAKIDAIAVTYGPGLIGSLLVGVETARTLALLSGKPLIPVNHMHGHIYANFIGKIDTTIEFPALALVVSGGHTDLVLLKSHTEISVIGGTRDDAAGEAFDKIGRLLGLPYPAGPVISRLAQKGNANAYSFPRPMIGSHDFDFSFSGLKTAVLNEVRGRNLVDQEVADISASVQQAIITVLTRKTVKAAKELHVRSLLLGGGVAANSLLQQTLIQEASIHLPKTTLFIPHKEYCTDNAAMIAAAAFFQNNPLPWQEVTCNPELYY